MPVKVLLFNSYDRALQQQKMHSSDFEYLGVKFTTPRLFISDLLAISGLHKKLLTDSERLGILLGVYSTSNSNFGNICSTGVISFLREFVENVGGLNSFVKRKNDILGGRIEVTGLEREVYKLSDEYFKYLDGNGEFMEACQFARQHCDIFKGKYDIELIDKIDLKPFEYELFSNISVSEINYKLPKVDESFNNIELDLNVLSGVRAQYSALKDEMKNIQKNERVLFVVDDPALTFEQTCSIANDINMDANIFTTANIAIKDTLIGRALFGFVNLKSGVNDLENVSDFLNSPYLNLNKDLSYAINAEMRSAEILESCEVEKILLDKCSNCFNNLTSFFSGENTDERLIFKLLEQLDKANQSEIINKEIEIQAINTICSIFKSYSKVSSDWDEGLVSAILDPKISVNYSNVDKTDSCPEDMIEIVITSSTNVKSFLSESFDRVVCFDVSELAYSIKEPRRSIDTTFKSLGLNKTMSEYDKTNYDFIALAEMLSNKTNKLTLYFLLHNIEEDEISVSFPMQELINSRYSSFDFEKITKSLLNNNIDYRIYGEDEIYSAFGNEDRVNLCDCAEYNFGNSGDYIIENILDYIPTKEFRGKTYPVLSPSQIEKYLQCPYKWFIESFIRPTQIDRRFDSAFLGSFAHDTFKLIYDRVTKEGLERFYKNDDELIENYVIEALQDNIQQYLENTSNHTDDKRYPRMDKQDIVKLSNLKDGIVGCIRNLSYLPDTMAVSKHESELSSELNTTFGGAIIKGRIDRIDVDTKNNAFCIIDYKSNTNTGYRTTDAGIKFDDGFVIPKHTQVYIYAKCIAQNFADEGLIVKPCAALYASYKSKQPDDQRIKGIIADNFVESDIFPNSKRFNAVDFENYLDELSGRVGLYIEKLCNGEITPCPNKDVCKYCSVGFCPAKIN